MTSYKITPQLHKKGRFPLDENTVSKMLFDLCKNSFEFNEYYTEHKPSIDKLHIKWYIDPNLKTKKGYASPLTTEITLVAYPISRDDGRIVAHEIEHLLIWNQGYPYVIVDPYDRLKSPRDPTLNNLGLSIQGMIYEPMVEFRLKKYFKNLCLSHQKNATDWLFKLKEKKLAVIDEIKTPRALLYYSCVYVKNCYLIKATGESKDSAEFVRAFNGNFGDTIAPCAEKIFSLIKTNMPIVPSSVEIILKTILGCEKFELSYQEQVSFNRFVIKSQNPLG